MQIVKALCKVVATSHFVHFCGNLERDITHPECSGTTNVSGLLIEDLTRVVISYEIYEASLWRVSSYEMTTSIRFCFSYDLFKLNLMAFKINIISLENATLSRTSL